MLKHLLKADISGIQEFIFNVTSKSAAKALKGRSFLIEAMGRMIEFKLRDELSSLFEVSTIYNGGGNVILELKSPSDREEMKIEFENIIKRVQSALNDHFSMETMSIQLSYVENNGKNFGTILQSLNEQSNSQKLKRFEHSDYFVFQPFERNRTRNYSNEKFAELTDELKKISKFYCHKKNNPIDLKNLLDVSIEFGEQSDRDTFAVPMHLPIIEKPIRELLLSEQNENPIFDTNELYEGSILSFQHLANLSKIRTGTAKLAILKMDVDNLSSLFHSIENKDDHQILSKEISDIFSTQLIATRNTRFYPSPTRKEEYKNYVEDLFQYKNNLYIVFAGGDDCIIIGGWDAILNFALDFHSVFERAENNIRSSDRLKQRLSGPITLSAGIVIVDPNFPVVKMSELAETALHKAKSTRHQHLKDASGNAIKSNVHVFGHTIVWKEFEELKLITEKFQSMIYEHHENKAFLQKMITSFDQDSNIDWQRIGYPFDPGILWRYPYHFRDVRKKEHKDGYFLKYFYDYFFKESADDNAGIYYKYVWNRFTTNKESSHMLPTAARWTELMIRNKTTEKK